MPLSVPSVDGELVASARRGDKPAFARLVEGHYPVLLGACRRALGDADLASDAAQEAAVQAMLGLDRLRQDDRFGPWLIGIGLNVCRRVLRARATGARSLDALVDGRLITEPIAPGPGPSELAELAEGAARVRRAVAGLPPGQREAVRLFYLAGLTQAEISEELGTPQVPSRPACTRRVPRCAAT